jgi:hypothetical protein
MAWKWRFRFRLPPKRWTKLTAPCSAPERPARRFWSAATSQGRSDPARSPHPPERLPRGVARRGATTPTGAPEPTAGRGRQGAPPCCTSASGRSSGIRRGPYTRRRRAGPRRNRRNGNGESRAQRCRSSSSRERLSPHSAAAACRTPREHDPERRPGAFRTRS